MKSLLLIRHAKSSWDFNVEDFDRPLNDRGKKSAPAMAKRLMKMDVKINAFISSPANRALSTAKYFAEEFGEKEKNIIIVRSLYAAASETFYKVVSDVDDKHKTVALFSHNPGITQFANMLTNTTVDDMPTCAIFAIKIDTKSWKDFSEANKQFWFFDYPKSKDE